MEYKYEVCSPPPENPCPHINLNYEEVERVLEICAEVGVYARDISPEDLAHRFEVLGGIIQAIAAYCPSLAQIKKFSAWVMSRKHKRVVKARVKYNEYEAAEFRKAYLDQKFLIDRFVDQAKPCRTLNDFRAIVKNEKLSMKIFYNLCQDQPK